MRGYIVAVVVLVGLHMVPVVMAIEGGKDIGGGFYNVLQLTLLDVFIQLVATLRLAWANRKDKVGNDYRGGSGVRSQGVGQPP